MGATSVPQRNRPTRPDSEASLFKTDHSKNQKRPMTGKGARTARRMGTSCQTAIALRSAALGDQPAHRPGELMELAWLLALRSAGSARYAARAVNVSRC